MSFIVGDGDNLERWQRENTTKYVDIDITICWHGLLKGHFPNRLKEIAWKIREEIGEVAPDDKIKRVFEFEGQEIIVFGFWKNEQETIFVNADLAFDGEGHDYNVVEEGDAVALVLSILINDTRTLH